MTEQEQEILLGRLAVHYKFLTNERGNEALKLWRSVGQATGQGLGDFLVAESYIAPDVLPKLLKARQEYLRRKGITPAEEAAPAAAPIPVAEPAPVTPAPDAPMPAPGAETVRLQTITPDMIAAAEPEPSVLIPGDSEATIRLEPAGAAPMDTASTVRLDANAGVTEVPVPGGETTMRLDPSQSVLQPLNDGLSTVRMDAAESTVRLDGGPPPVAEMDTIRLQQGPADMPTIRMTADEQPQPIAEMQTLRMAPDEAAAVAQPAAETPPSVVEPASAETGPNLLGYQPGMSLEQLLTKATELGASDLHLHSGAPIKLRLNGELTDASPPVDKETARELIFQVLTEEQQKTVDDRLQLDFSYPLEGVARFRANTYFQHRGMDGVFRIIPPKPPTLEELGMPDILKRLAAFHQGMVLFTGPAGCGKSSTMAAMVDMINKDRPDHILTIEEPIEYVHTPARCVVNQREVGPHTESFARALRGALREDPDIIVIGELRDLETIELALTAAETGHLVLGTLHTASTIPTINRLVGVFPPDAQAQIRMMVSESIRGIISQRLVPRADGEGRVPALEILINNKAIGNLIRENRTFQITSVLQTGSSLGMCMLDSSLAELVKDGTITQESARRAALDPKKFA